MSHLGEPCDACEGEPEALGVQPLAAYVRRLCPSCLGELVRMRPPRLAKRRAPRALWSLVTAAAAELERRERA